MREGDEPRLDKSRKKAGTKLTMAGLIIELTNACKAATSVLEEAHQQNLYKYRNVIIHGLSTDVEDDYKDRLDDLESAIEDVLGEANPSGRYFEINEFVVLGKLGENERAPPVLVRLKNENDSKIVLKGKNRLQIEEI